MKTIGLIGGMSWESSLEYYRILNEETKLLLGDTHSADCLMYSFDFDEVEKLQHRDEWEKLTQLMVDKAEALKMAGAAFIVICTNTMHLMAEDISSHTGLEVLHIARATGQAILEKKLDKVLLLGTKFTMEGNFYKDVLNDMNIEVIIPSDQDRTLVHEVIYKELIKGVFIEESRQAFINIIEKAKVHGAEGVILGCTEIPLLIQQEHTDVHVFDTTEIHAKAAVKHAIED